jgi:hypothetical protein
MWNGAGSVEFGLGRSSPGGCLKQRWGRLKRALLEGRTMARPAAAAARAQGRVPRAAVRRGSSPGPGRQTKDLKGL